MEKYISSTDVSKPNPELPLIGSIPVNGSFDAQLLHDLAKITGGSTFHAADKEGLKQVMREINALEKTNISQPKPVNFREFAPVVALISLAILLLGIIAQHSWKMRLP